MKPKQALIIQEDIIILKILQRLAISNAFHCKAISSLDQLDIEDQNIYFDVIISDILFDGIAPLEFVSQLQEVITHKNLIILTNMGQEKIAHQILLDKKVYGFFAVPYDLDKIEKMIA